MADSSHIGLTHTVKVFMTTLSYAAMAASIATDLVEAKKCDDKAVSLREGVNKQIVVMHKDNVVVGRKGKCAIADAFVRALLEGGLAGGTSANYLSTFRDAVKSGKPVTDWNPNRKGAKAKSAKGKKGFADKLATVYRDGEFEGFINDLQASWHDAEIKTLMEGVKSYLEASGIEIK